MIQQIVTIAESEDMEVWAAFNVYHSPAFEAEIGNPNTHVAAGEEIYLEKVCLNLGKVNVNILPLLNKEQKEEVINLIKQKTE